MKRLETLAMSIAQNKNPPGIKLCPYFDRIPHVSTFLDTRFSYLESILLKAFTDDVAKTSVFFHSLGFH
jgi:hypothetical protein